jgi:hypothetical protein
MMSSDDARALPGRPPTGRTAPAGGPCRPAASDRRPRQGLDRGDPSPTRCDVVGYDSRQAIAARPGSDVAAGYGDRGRGATVGEGFRRGETVHLT